MTANPPIVDAHHHVWRQRDLAWLQGPSVARIFGTYDPIKRDYPMQEFLADLAGTGVMRSIYVQTNWPAGGALDEVRWVSEVAAETGWPHAIVSHVDLLDERAPDHVEAQAAFPLVRGVRQQLHWHENPQYRFASRPDLPRDPTLRRNLAELGCRGWPFDLQVFTSQMDDAVDLARAVPGTTFVLDHAGMLEDLTPEGVARWRAGLDGLAGCQNVHAKLSGLGTFLHRNDPDHIAFVVRETVARFGPTRCLWGSNFPIEKLWTDYPSLVAATRAALAPFTDEDAALILGGNAARLYGLEL